MSEKSEGELGERFETLLNRFNEDQQRFLIKIKKKVRKTTEA